MKTKTNVKTAQEMYIFYAKQDTVHGVLEYSAAAILEEIGELNIRTALELTDLRDVVVLLWISENEEKTNNLYSADAMSAITFVIDCKTVS